MTNPADSRTPVETESSTERYERLAAEFERDTGMIAPGKDVPAEMGGPDVFTRSAAWDRWWDERRANRTFCRECAGELDVCGGCLTCGTFPVALVSPPSAEERRERALTAAVHWARARAALDRAEGMEDAARCLELLVTALDDTRSHVARLTRERDEMKDALRRIGVFRSDEAGDDGSEWCVTFEPRGEEPIGTLDEALAEVERVTYSDGARDERKRLQSALDALAIAVQGCGYRPTMPDWNTGDVIVSGLLCGDPESRWLCRNCTAAKDAAITALLDSRPK